MIEFTVIGLPAPQGSKAKWGAEENKRTKPWRDAVAADAEKALNGTGMLCGPVEVEATFVFPRPKSHYRTGAKSNELRPDAPSWVTTKPDLDKLLRAIGDALTGVLLRDDSQIVYWRARMVYGNPVRCDIRLEAL